VIPPDEIAGYVRKYHIKSIVDLRMPGTDDLTLNPEKLENTGRKECCRKIDGINYFSNPSEQVPNKENIKTLQK
jgi:hypothetical protein